MSQIKTEDIEVDIKEDRSNYDIIVDTIGLSVIGANRNFQTKFITIQSHLHNNKRDDLKSDKSE